ncbi:Histidine kinase N-terminal 7TM region domain-containing protein [Zobellia nedashkovskayae]
MPIYGVTLLLSLYKYPRYFDSKLKYLPILFFYTLLNEFLGYLINNYEEFSLISADTYHNYNWLIYNIYMLIFYLYFYYIFRFYIEDLKHKQHIVYGAIFFLAVCLVNAFIDDFSKLPQVYSYVTGGLILIYCSVLYLKKFFAIDKIFTTKENLLFWLSTGLVVFYAGYLPIKVIRYIHTIHETPTPPIVKRIQFTLIIVSYLCFIIGFLRMRRRLPE